jgi:PAS domain S-box-containing protein
MHRRALQPASIILHGSWPIWAIGGFLVISLSLTLQPVPLVPPVRTALPAIPAVFAAVAGLALIRDDRQSERRLASFLSAALLLWGAGYGISLAQALIFPGNAVLIATANLFILAGYPSFAVWLYLCLPPIHRRFRGFRVILDIIVSCVALATMISFLFINPFISGGLANNHNLFWMLAFPVADLGIILTVLNVLLLGGNERWQSRLRIAGLGFTILFTSELARLLLISFDEIGDNGWVDFGKTAAICLLLLIVFLKPPAETQAQKGLSRQGGKMASWIQPVVPYAATILLVWYAIVDFQVQKTVNAPMAILVASCTVLLVLRQGVIAGEIEMQQYAFLVTVIAESAFICDPMGKFVLVNPAFCTAVGVEPDTDLHNLSLQDILASKDMARYVISQAGMGEWSGEAEMVRTDGARFPVSMAIRQMPMQNQKQPFLVGTAHDLTEQKRQQANLQNTAKELQDAKSLVESFNTSLEAKIAEKTFSLIKATVQLEQQNTTLQRLDELKSDFVSLVSHELRAPLTNISSGIELLLENQNGLSKDAAETLEIVEAEVRRLGRFVETILDVTALDAGHIPFYCAPTSLQAVVGTLSKQFSSLPGWERIVWRIPPDMPYIYADERALSSILIHLIDNANKYAPEGSITIDARVEEGRAEIQVGDCGPGIPPDTIPLLFNKFYRLHQGDSQTVYGHGLGLYIVSRLLQMMDGEIRVENNASGGASFIFRLKTVEEQDGSENPSR